MKILYILLAGLCLCACEKTKIEDVIREVEPEQAFIHLTLLLLQSSGK